MVFFFHAGPIEGKDAEIVAKLEEFAQRSPAPNLVYRAIDTADATGLERLDPDVRRFWETQGEKKTPWWLVASAWGAVLHCGDWDPRAAEELVDSPLRRKVAELLHAGDAVVFVLLEGSDEKQNADAATAAEKVIADAKAGKIASPGDALVVELGGPDGTGSAKDAEIRVSLVTVTADQAAEQGLIGQLLMVEPGLKEEVGTPMLFPVYGRGRAMPPFIGKGINEQNLSDAVRFLIGDCSCLAKEQNPGVDLCFAWDWESTADKWSLEEETNPAMRRGSSDSLVYQEFSVDELAQGTQAGEGITDESGAPATEVAAKPEAADVAGTIADKIEAPASVGTKGQEPASAPSIERRQAWTVALVLGVLALGVFIGGAFVLRR